MLAAVSETNSRADRQFEEQIILEPIFVLLAVVLECARLRTFSSKDERSFPGEDLVSVSLNACRFFQFEAAGRA